MTTFQCIGRDGSAASRGEYAGFLIKSKDDGSSFTDETGGITTSQFGGSTIWYEDDLYLTTSGEGILLKGGFDL